jgi:C4-dicarboxylate transporter DctM subunit
MNETMVGIAGIVSLLLLFATGIELGFAMALVGFVGFAYLNGFYPAINLLATDFYDVITNYGYTVFPLFVLMGQIGFKTICGSSAATAATFAGVAIPEMDRYGYDKKLSTGIVATVGSLGCIIPPSVVLIILGILTEQSIGQLFLAGIIPGLIIALFFMGIIYGWARINPAPSQRCSGS